MLILLSLASAGYGDAIDGRPSHVERETHFWTNAVRVDPASFESDYPCSFNSFQASEKTPKVPLLWDHGLGEAARVHSDDMNARNYFAHDTQGGPSFSQRVWSYYDGGAIGENIAYGYGTAWRTVVEGWMCSSGHRSNIMATDFDELGTGVSGTYYTQDFGDGNPPVRALAMGIHLPVNPTDNVDLGVDWTLSTAPDAVFAVVDGERFDLDLYRGDPSGWSVWSTRVSIGGGCHEYYFVGESAGIVQTFPEDGSYTFGGCSNDDPDAGWIASQLPWEEDVIPTGDDDDDDAPISGDDDDDSAPGDDDDDVSSDGTDSESLSGDFDPSEAGGCGCTSGTFAGGWAPLLLAIAGVWRRKSGADPLTSR